MYKNADIMHSIFRTVWHLHINLILRKVGCGRGVLQLSVLRKILLVVRKIGTQTFICIVETFFDMEILNEIKLRNRLTLHSDICSVNSFITLGFFYLQYTFLSAPNVRLGQWHLQRTNWKVYYSVIEYASLALFSSRT